MGENQRHVGILHKNSSTREVLNLHLAWHYSLKNDPPRDYYAWIDPEINSDRAIQVSALCRRIFRAHAKGLPYAFSAPNDCFNTTTGEYLFGPGKYGLTCSSFVLAVFHSAGLPLIIYDTWPKSRDGDPEWKLYVKESLEKQGADREHIGNLELQKDGIRFRPEDVAGAAASDKIPVAFQEAFEKANEILEMLKAEKLHTPD